MCEVDHRGQIAEYCRDCAFTEDVAESLGDRLFFCRDPACDRGGMCSACKEDERGDWFVCDGENCTMKHCEACCEKEDNGWEICDECRKVFCEDCARKAFDDLPSDGDPGAPQACRACTARRALPST